MKKSEVNSQKLKDRSASKTAFPAVILVGNDLRVVPSYTAETNQKSEGMEGPLR